MHSSLLQTSLALLGGIVVIILLTVRYKLHPFFALLIACFVTGLGVQLPVEEILKLIKAGVGDILSKLTLIIVLGTAIGVLLENNGSTRVMANLILRIIGIKRSSMALSITGFIVGLPIFCDSGYIVLNGINHSLIQRTGYSVARMSISLAAGLYAVHCLIPPHPGATAAAATLAVDFGRLILYGIVVAIPAMLIGHWWAVYASKGGRSEDATQIVAADQTVVKGPKTFLAFLPVLVPILLMAVKSVSELGKKEPNGWQKLLGLLGDPAVALAIGVILAILITEEKKSIAKELGAAVEKAASILIIIAAGAAFGAILGATQIGAHFSNSLNLSSLGIWFPFLLTALIKTAQGSSTVAIITASSIVLPLLPALGLDNENGRMLVVLAMGAGSMMVSHTNDAYFWVISKFSSIDIKTMLRVHSVASIWMGLIAALAVYLLSLFIL